MAKEEHGQDRAAAANSRREDGGSSKNDAKPQSTDSNKTARMHSISDHKASDIQTSKYNHLLFKMTDTHDTQSIRSGS